MKLVFLFLFAVSCCALDNGLNKDEKTLLEAKKILAAVVQAQQSNMKKLSSPPENIEEHCCPSALMCFQVNLREHFNTTDLNIMRLGKSLRRINIIFSQNFSNSGNNTTTCDVCNSHPEVNVQEFLSRLTSLIERAITKMTKK